MQTEGLERFVGQTVSDCRVEQLVSCGRMSAVYRGQQLRPNRPVACTLFLLPEACSTQTRQLFRQRFLRLCPALMTLRHPHLLPVYGYGEWEGLPYLLTPYRTEGSLANTLKQRGAYTPAETLKVLEQVTAGLEHAHHQGLVHGMLTPAHLLVSADRPVQIAGLGLLRLLERRGLLPVQEPCEQALTITGAPLVALRYLSPEYLQGEPAAIRSDVYALGVVLVELLAGRAMSAEMQPLDLLMQLQRWLPPAMDQVLRQALSPDPALRFRRVSDLLAAWALALEQEEEKQTRIQWSTPLPAVQALPPSAFGRELVDTAFLPASVSWPQTSKAQRALPAKPEKRREGTGESLQRQGLAPRTLSRRRVTAMLVAGAAMGIIGSAGIGLAKMLSTRPAAQPPTPGRTTSVIGTTQLALNSALPFTDLSVSEKRQRLLIHLPNGSFVAYKQGCTHSGVLVNYDPKTQMLVCPAHGAIFDPAQGGRVVQGPATLPLPQVTIHVHSDGTMTL